MPRGKQPSDLILKVHIGSGLILKVWKPAFDLLHNDCKEKSTSIIAISIDGYYFSFFCEPILFKFVFSFLVFLDIRIASDAV